MGTQGRRRAGEKSTKHKIQSIKYKVNGHPGEEKSGGKEHVAGSWGLAFWPCDCFAARLSSLRLLALGWQGGEGKAAGRAGGASGGCTWLPHSPWRPVRRRCPSRRRLGSAAAPLEVRLATADVTAHLGTDYTGFDDGARESSLTFAAGARVLSVQIGLLQV